MNTLIVIAGNASSPFFLNELGFMKKNYDEVYIIDSNHNAALGKWIEAEYGFKYVYFRPYPFSWAGIKRFVAWMKQDSVQEEIASNVTLSIAGIKKWMYILLYGIMSVNGRLIIDQILDASEGKVDIYSFWLSRPAYLAAQYNEHRSEKVCNIISRAHGYDLYFERNPLAYLPFRSFIDQNLDAIYFISEDGKSYYESQYHVQMHAERAISKLGVFEPEFKKNASNKDEIVIASCSYLVPVKRVDLIIDVIAQLKDMRIKWIHFGDGKLRQQLEKQCADCLMPGQYKFFGSVANQELLKTYQEEDVDFFINLSDSEGVPVSIMEAMSFGIPVIARDVGGNREIVDASNGLLLGAMSKEDMAKLIRDFIEKSVCDKAFYRQACMNAALTWDREYNAERNYSELYAKAFKGRSVAEEK